MKKYVKFSQGFSLAEALAVLLIVAIAAAVTVPMITKKNHSLSKNAVHGKWACKYVDGVLKSATARNVDEELPPDNKWQTGCKFPSVAKTVKYLWVEVYGGGGGGAGGYATPWISKTYSYSLGTPAPRDGEYDVSVNPSNSGSSMSWKNDTYYSSNGIYYTTDENLKSTCSGSSFADFFEEDTDYTYASCKTYTAEDKCVYTGDSSAIKTTDCIPSVGKAGRYCYNSTSVRPPNAYYSESYMLSRCNSDRTEECSIGEKGIYYTSNNKKCLNKRTLPYVYGGSSAPGVSGKIYLKEGEYLRLKTAAEGQKYKEGNLGGYEHTSAKDGNDYSLYHTKSTVQNGVMHLNDVLAAKMYGGTAGVYTLSKTGATRCCTNCGKLEKYINSSKTDEVFCAKDGVRGSTTIMNAYKGLLDTGYVSKSEISILNQDFEYFFGCNGKNGSYTANLFPASRNHQYDIHVGKGGSGAKGDGSNTRTESAQNGEETYFGWIRAEGGQGAADFCKVKKAEEAKTNAFNAGTGGQGGTVELPGGKIPKRNYTLTVDEDTHPNGRWKVTDGKDGTSGIIVVSW